MKPIVFSVKTILLFLLCFQILDLSAQQGSNQFSFKEINTDDFPNVKVKVWVRDPNGIVPANVEFIEENNSKSIKPTFNSKTESKDSLAKNKCIVFLIFNPGSGGMTELNWYKSLVKTAIRKGDFKKGDKIAVLDYNNEAAGQPLLPSTLNFTDDLGKVDQMVNDIKPRNVPCLCGGIGRGLGINAINRTLERLEMENIKMPKGIFFISNDLNCNEARNIDKARKMDIPVYAVTYNQGGVFNTSEIFCKQTHGLYNPPSTDQTACANKLSDFLKGFLQRQAGFEYSFTYKSAYEKDGGSHALTISYGTEKTTGRMELPNKNIIEWIVANPIVALLILIILAGGAFFLNGFLKKNKKQKEDQKKSEEERLKELDRVHKENEEKLEKQIRNQQQELENIKKQEQAKLDQERKRKQLEEEKKNEAQLISQMKLKGNYAWLDYTTGDGQKNRFTISQPVILVGRDPSCQLCVNLPTVSKNHFQINYTSSNEYWVKDVGSSNGLYVNGQKLQQARLKHGDCIQAGELVLNFFI